jgi:tripartite ATP-independent transporter DctP family solute receptor
MRRLLIGAVASLAGLAVLGGIAPRAFSATAKPFTAEYKLYTPTPADHVYSMGAQRFADLVKERSGGRIKITVFPANQLAKGEREALEGLQQGTIDFYAGSTGPVGNFAPAFQMLDVPFLFANYAHVDKVLDGDLGKSLLAELDRAQIKGLAFWENGFRNLTNSKHPVRLPPDVRDIKIRTMENKVHIEAWRTLGAAPTPMAWGEVYGALQGKVIDGQENPVAVVYSSKLNEVQKYMTLTRHVYSPAIVAVGAGPWNQIPKADQDLLTKTAVEVASYQRKLGRDQESKWIGDLKQRGMEIVETVDVGAWQTALKPVFDKYAQQFGERFRKISTTR